MALAMGDTKLIYIVKNELSVTCVYVITVLHRLGKTGFYLYGYFYIDCLYSVFSELSVNKWVQDI